MMPSYPANLPAPRFTGWSVEPGKTPLRFGPEGSVPEQTERFLLDPTLVTATWTLSLEQGRDWYNFIVNTVNFHGWFSATVKLPLVDQFGGNLFDVHMRIVSPWSFSVPGPYYQVVAELEIFSWDLLEAAAESGSGAP